MANFIGLVYATLKQEGIDTKGMDTDEAVKKYKELQSKNGKSGEKEGTPAEQRKLQEKGIDVDYSKTTKDDSKIINKYKSGNDTHIISKTKDGKYVVGYNYNENTGKFSDSETFETMASAEASFRKKNPSARLTEQNLGKKKTPSLTNTDRLRRMLRF